MLTCKGDIKKNGACRFSILNKSIYIIYTAMYILCEDHRFFQMDGMTTANGIYIIHNNVVFFFVKCFSICPSSTLTFLPLRQLAIEP